MPSVPLFTNALLLTSILSCSVAADEPTKSTPATPAQAPVADSSSDPQPLPDGIQRFNGMLVGRLLKRDVEKGSFVIAVDAVSRVWENSRAESPASLVGRRIEVSGVFGKFLDVLVVTRVGETLEFECRHDGDKLVFPGELLRKVAPYAPEDYPVLPEEFRGFRGIVQAEVLKKDPESLEMIIRVDRVLSSASGNAARNPPSIEGKNLLLAGFWNRREAFAGIKPGDKLEAGLQHISRRSDHVAVADPIRRTAVGPGARRMSEEEMRELQRPEQNSVGRASADNVPAGQRGFRGMLVGRLVSKDIERGTFSMQVEVVPRVWKNNQSADPRALRGKIVEAGGVSGKLLDVLLLCKTGETLEFGAKDDGGSRLTVIETLRKVGPVQPGDYPELPDDFRGFKGMLTGRVLRKDNEAMELTVEVTAVGRLFAENLAKQPQSIVSQKVTLAGFWNRRDAFQSLAIDSEIEFGAEHPQRYTDHLVVFESFRPVQR